MADDKQFPLTEEDAWKELSFEERFRQYCLLFDFYVKAGGSLSPAYDSQSPFNFPEYYVNCEKPAVIRPMPNRRVSFPSTM